MDPHAALRRAGERAVKRWDDFPYNAVPRPMVLLDSPARVDGSFATGDAKLAFLSGVVAAARSVPDEPVRLLRQQHPPGARLPSTPLKITRAVLAEAPFATDRGEQVCAAWRVEAAGTNGFIWVLTEQARGRCWAPPASAERLGPRVLDSAVVDTDGRGLTVVLVGGPASLFDYDAEVVESATAVTAIPMRHTIRRLPPRTFITAVGHTRTVHARLQHPLDGRVLVNLDGTPVGVRPAST